MVTITSDCHHSAHPEPVEGRPPSTYERTQRQLDLPDLVLVCRVMRPDPMELLRRLDNHLDRRRLPNSTEGGPQQVIADWLNRPSPIKREVRRMKSYGSARRAAQLL